MDPATCEAYEWTTIGACALFFVSEVMPFIQFCKVQNVNEAGGICHLLRRIWFSDCIQKKIPKRERSKSETRGDSREKADAFREVVDVPVGGRVQLSEISLEGKD